MCIAQKRRFILVIGAMMLLVACSETGPKEKKTNYPSGNLRESFWVDAEGRRDGAYTAYYEHGIVKESSQYAANKKNGNCRTFFSNGRLESSVDYKDNLPVGEAFFYYNNNYIRKQESYNAESQLIQSKSYYPNGTLMYHGAFRIPSGDACAFKTLTKNRFIIPEKSNFVKIRRTGGRSFMVKLYHPDCIEYDSIVVSVVKSVRPEKIEDLEVMRTMRFRSQPFEVTIEEEDFAGYKIGYLVLGYGKGTDGIQKTHEFRMHWNKSESIPMDNIRPLF